MLTVTPLLRSGRTLAGSVIRRTEKVQRLCEDCHYPDDNAAREQCCPCLVQRAHLKSGRSILCDRNLLAGPGTRRSVNQRNMKNRHRIRTRILPHDHSFDPGRARPQSLSCRGAALVIQYEHYPLRRRRHALLNGRRLVARVQQERPCRQPCASGTCAPPSNRSSPSEHCSRARHHRNRSRGCVRRVPGSARATEGLSSTADRPSLGNRSTSR
jgi:hypothetical protein